MIRDIFLTMELCDSVWELAIAQATRPAAERFLCSSLPAINRVFHPLLQNIEPLFRHDANVESSAEKILA